MRDQSSVVVLADDLTSAADGAVPFRRSGHRALVLFDPPGTSAGGESAAGATAGGATAGGGLATGLASAGVRPAGASAAGLVPDGVRLAGATAAEATATGLAPDAARPAGVTAVDLGTRLVDEAGAAARMKEAAGAYAGADLLLKTVDSTLRGHVAAEVRATLAGSGRRAAVVAPAFPAEGRTTVRGVQYVRGVRVDESEFARDPAHPVRTADLTRLLPESTVVEPDRLAGLPELLAEGGVFVCSAATAEDLDAIVAAVPRAEDVLWVGSPGLAAALARRHGRAPTTTGVPGLPPVRRPLAVVGSANPASRRQLAALYARSGADGAVAEDSAAAVAALSASRAPLLAVHTPDARDADPGALTRRLAETTAEAVGKGLADGLVLTGGETAAAVLAALGATGIDLHDEPEPGIARGTLHGPTAPRIPVLVKAGGFGDDGTLVRLCALLTAGDRATTRTEPRPEDGIGARPKQGGRPRPERGPLPGDVLEPGLLSDADPEPGAPPYGGAPQPGPLPGGAPQPGPLPGGAPQPGPLPGGAPQPGPLPGDAPQPGPLPGGSPQPGHVPGDVLEPGLLSDGDPEPGPPYGGAPEPGPLPGGAPQPGPLLGSAPEPRPLPDGTTQPKYLSGGAPAPRPGARAEARPHPDPRPFALTMGDPHGIGPEIIVKVCADPRRRVPVLVIGDPVALVRACRATGIALAVRTVASAAEAARADGGPGEPGVLDVLPEGPALPAEPALGTVDGRAGAASFAYVRRGIELALAGEVRAITTAPINKEALRLAGVPYPGHTEILAALSGTERFAMMMANDELRTVLVTSHLSLRAAIDALTPERELDTIRLTHRTLGPGARIAVAGLNPHAGENGLFGREDLDVIAPAVRAARAEGIDASGPHPADTVFMRARAGEFDAVVAQYHDQGLIPVKYLGLEHGVNITLGLPFVRTSVDHGTAFDLAGTGTADHTSLLTALHHAAELADHADHADHA